MSIRKYIYLFQNPKSGTGCSGDSMQPCMVQAHSPLFPKTLLGQYYQLFLGGSESSSDDSSKLESLRFRLIRKSGQVET